MIHTFCDKVLDVEGQANGNGTRIIQWDPNGGANQYWRLVNPKVLTSSSSDSDWKSMKVIMNASWISNSSIWLAYESLIIIIFNDIRLFENYE